MTVQKLHLSSAWESYYEIKQEDTKMNDIAIKILDKYIEQYDNILNDNTATRIRKSIAENEKNLLENIKGDILNAKENN